MSSPSPHRARNPKLRHVHRRARRERRTERSTAHAQPRQRGIPHRDGQVPPSASRPRPGRRAAGGPRRFLACLPAASVLHVLRTPTAQSRPTNKQSATFRIPCSPKRPMPTPVQTAAQRAKKYLSPRPRPLATTVGSPWSAGLAPVTSGRLGRHDPMECPSPRSSPGGEVGAARPARHGPATDGDLFLWVRAGVEGTAALDM